MILNLEVNEKELSEMDVIRIKLISNICEIEEEYILKTLFYTTKEHLKRQKEKETD